MTLTSIALLMSLSQTETPPPAEETTETKPVATEEVKAATEEPPAAPVAPNPWAISVSGGITWITGNVISLTAVGNASATRKTEKTIFILKLFAGYGEKYGPLPREILLLNGGLTAQFDYRFNKTVSMFIGAGLDADHVKSVELRGYGELGVGLTWVDIKGGDGEKEKDLQKVLVKTDLGIRAQPELRFQYYPTPIEQPDVLMVGPRLYQVLQYSFSSTTYVREELEFLPNVIGSARFLLNSTTKAAVGLVSVLSATATFALRYDSAPAAGKRPVDTVFTLGVEANF